MYGKMNISNKKNYFQHSINFELSLIYGNSINNYDFVKFIISAKGGHCTCSPHTLKDLATPLLAVPCMHSHHDA